MGNYFSRHRLPPLTTKKEAEASEENRKTLGHLLKVAGVSTLFFFAVSKLVEAGASKTAFYKAMSPGKQRRFPTYVTSMLHAVVGTVFSAKKILVDKPEDQKGIRNQMAFTLGYFVQDLIATMPDWIAHPQELIHHVAAITVILGCMACKCVTEYIPRFLIVESSTVALDLMWFLKETGNASTTLYKVTTITFATLFAATRVVWMPYALMEVMHNQKEKFKGLGPARFALAPVTALQFYWFYRILLMLRK